MILIKSNYLFNGILWSLYISKYAGQYIYNRLTLQM